MFRGSSSSLPARPLIAAALAAAAMSCATASAVTIAEFAIPTPHAVPTSITGAADGNLWFTEFQGNVIGRITPEGRVTEFSLGATYPNPVAITAARDGAVWFLEGDRIGKMTTSGTLSEYPLPFGYNSDARGITAGPDGNVWFTETRCAQCDPSAPGQIPDDGATIGKITPQGAITEFTLADYHAGPRSITSGPDGNLWFTEDANKIGRISPTGAVTEFALPVPNSFPMGIAAGSDGNLWFVESRCPGDCGNDVRVTGKLVIGRITPTGVITEYSTQSGNWYNGPETIGIVEGADHNMWFAEPKSNKIGRITHAGEITEFEVPSRLNDPNVDPLASTEPLGITNGPDGNVWFVEAGPNVGGRVGKLDLAATAPDPPAITITSGFTGNWFSPNQSGHGFSLEVLRDSQMLADWYVFAPNGGQSWIVAMGPISGNTAVLQAQQAVGPGGQFPPNFNPARVNAKAWGTITFTFTDCNNGQVSWQPTASGYTSGSMPITRLTMPAGLSCQ
jgi:streptogramin lyase